MANTNQSIDDFLGTSSTSDKSQETPVAKTSLDEFLSPVPMPSPELLRGEVSKPKEYDFRESAIGGAAGFGAAAGAFAPEMMRAAGAIPGPVGVSARAIQPLIGGTRLGRALGGGASGAISETAGQALEVSGFPGAPAEIARFAVGALPGESVRLLGNLAARIPGPIGGVIRGISSLSSSQAANLSASRNAEIDKIVSSIAKTPYTPEIGSRLIKNIDEQIAADLRLAEGNQRTLIENAANSAKQMADFSVAKAGAPFDVRMETVKRQFNDNMSKLRQAAEDEANKILLTGIKRANIVRANRTRESEALAQQIERQAQDVADKYISETTRRIESLTRLSNVRSTGSVRAIERQQRAIREVGTPMGETELGVELRNPAIKQFEAFKKKREDDIVRDKEAAFATAYGKEKEGKRITETAAYNEGVAEIEKMIKSEFGTARVTSDLKKQLDNVLKEMKGITGTAVTETGQPVEVVKTPAGIDLYEVLRRKLNDRANGIPQEGYDAIGQQLAGKLEKIVTKVMDDFASKDGGAPITNYLNAYREASKPINQYKSNLGKALTGRADYDFSRFETDPIDIAKYVFKSKTSVNDYVTQSGASADDLNKVASSYVANRLRTEKPEAILREDWIGFDVFAPLRERLSAAVRTGEFAAGAKATRLARAEAALKEAGKLKGALAPQNIEDIVSRERARLAKQPAPTKRTPEEEMAAASARAAEVRKVDEGPKIKALESELSRISAQQTEAIAAAEKSSKELTDRALSEAKAKGQIDIDRINEIRKIIGDKDPIPVIEGIIFGKQRAAQLGALRDYIVGTEQGSKDFTNMLNNRIAQRAKTGNIDSVIDEFNNQIAPALLQNKLVGQGDIARISSSLNNIKAAKMRVDEQMSAAQRIILNSVKQGIAQAGGLAFDPMRTQRIMDLIGKGE